MDQFQQIDPLICTSELIWIRSSGRFSADQNPADGFPADKDLLTGSIRPLPSLACVVMIRRMRGSTYFPASHTSPRRHVTTDVFRADFDPMVCTAIGSKSGGGISAGNGPADRFQRISPRLYEALGKRFPNTAFFKQVTHSSAPAV